MSHPYPHIIQEVSHCRFVAVEPLRTSSGLHGLGILAENRFFFIPKKEWWDEFVKEMFSQRTQFVCFDMRRIMDLVDDRVIDMKTILGGGETTILARMRYHFPSHPVTLRLTDVEGRMAANLRAVKTAHVEGSVLKTMASQFFDAYLKSRVESISMLFEKYERSPEIDNWWRRADFVRVVHEIELNGIRIDKDFVDAQIIKPQSPATLKAFRSMSNLYRNGYVTALFNAAGTKTGRLRPEGGFGAMGIPHGPARQAVISRFPNGKIYSFDYNAIDYRSIVSTIGGAFGQLYASSTDFHHRTAQFILSSVDELQRDTIKAISYTFNYGGNESTLADRTGLSVATVKMILDSLSPHLQPIADFRDRLWGKFQIDGFIEVPGVGEYRKQEGEDMHPGKLLAIYAQGYSAYVFERAMVRVHKLLKEHGRGSCIIFPVHDELVVDIHPVDEESGLPMEIVREMESGVAEGFVVNYKKGRSYGEIE